MFEVTDPFAGGQSLQPITILSYNVLAQCYVTSRFFPYAAPEALRAKTRIPLMIRQLKAANADILALQEVDQFDRLKEALHFEYEGLFLKRPGAKRDGCAIFFRRSRFHLLESDAIQFDELANGMSPRSVEDLLRHNVALLLMLEEIGGNFRFVIGSAHLFWNPSFMHVKLAQVKEYIDRASVFRKDCPVVLCGDLNASPTTPLYRRLVAGHELISPTDPDMLVPQGGKQTSAISISDDPDDYSAWDDGTVKRQSLPNLRSAFSLYRPQGEPPYTNLVPKFCETIDYIFYTPPAPGTTGFGVEALGQFGTKEEHTAEVALPSTMHPSDHLPLVARLREFVQ